MVFDHLIGIQILHLVVLRAGKTVWSLLKSRTGVLPPSTGGMICGSWV